MLNSFLKLCSFSQRSYSLKKNINKFYKNVSIAQQNKNEFQILIDSKVLKTPNGNILAVNNENLAHAIAQEWDSQDKTVKRHSMHLTSLCNTSIDNPTARSPKTIVKGLLEYLDSDTISFRCKEPEELYELQRANWDPILDYISRQYKVTPIVTESIILPKMPHESRIVFENLLLDNNIWGLTGYQHCIETLKSVYLTLALTDNLLSIEQAVRLSRLEYEYQVNKWGNVPWYHEVEQAEMQARVAASVLLIYSSQNKQHSVNRASR